VGVQSIKAWIKLCALAQIGHHLPGQEQEQQIQQSGLVASPVFCYNTFRYSCYLMLLHLYSIRFSHRSNICNVVISCNFVRKYKLVQSYLLNFNSILNHELLPFSHYPYKVNNFFSFQINSRSLFILLNNLHPFLSCIR
jgi:hypothetical protein